jgi:hypothetical protein
LSVAAVSAAIVVTPFVLPYVRVSRELQLARSIGETTRLSRDVYSYATASVAQRFWGLRVSDVYQKREGELFPGVVRFSGLIGLVFAGPSPLRGAPRWMSAAGAFRAVAIGHFVAAVAVILYRRLTVDLWFFDVRLIDATQLLLRADSRVRHRIVAVAELRLRFAAFMRSRGFFVAAMLAAMWLSLGPSPQVLWTSTRSCVSVSLPVEPRSGIRGSARSGPLRDDGDADAGGARWLWRRCDRAASVTVSRR